jgi:hypothetical protein
MIRNTIRNIAFRLGLLPFLSMTLNLARRIKRAAISQEPEPGFNFQSTIGIPRQPREYSKISDIQIGRREDARTSLIRSGFPYQVDYSQHPAFIEHLVWNGCHDREADELVDTLNKQLLDLESALSLNLMRLPEAVARVTKNVGVLIDLLVTSNNSVGADFRPFAERFQCELMRVIIDDLAYFERRNTYVPVINNAAELALRNELAVKGFLEFDLKTDELTTLRQHMKSYAELLESRYQQGLRSREELTTGEVNYETVVMLSEVFAGRGIDKAVSDVRHEQARAWGFGIELSPYDNDWWHSRYEDVGLLAPAKAAYFHNDESRDVYKAIIYLDDVDEDLGPFCYLPASYAMERPRFEWVVARANLTTVASEEIRLMMSDLRASRGPFTSRVARGFFGMLPPRLRLNSHFGFDVPDDSELASLLQSQEVRMIAPAGRVIVFDGSRIVHRGGLVRRGKRTALQLCFSVEKQNGLDLYRDLNSVLGGESLVV